MKSHLPFIPTQFPGNCRVVPSQNRAWKLPGPSSYCSWALKCTFLCRSIWKLWIFGESLFQHSEEYLSHARLYMESILFQLSTSSLLVGVLFNLFHAGLIYNIHLVGWFVGWLDRSFSGKQWNAALNCGTSNIKILLRPNGGLHQERLNAFILFHPLVNDTADFGFLTPPEKDLVYLWLSLIALNFWTLPP